MSHETPAQFRHNFKSSYSRITHIGFEIKIIGIDENRPPRIDKDSHIKLFFKLSRIASKEWCNDFNTIGKQLAPPAKMETQQGLYIETQVYNIEHIQSHLDNIKAKVQTCNNRNIESFHREDLVAAEKLLLGNNGIHEKLNKIIANLNFDNL